MLKTYTLTVTLQEGNDEFWEALQGSSGCDEVTAEVKASLAEHGWVEPYCTVELVKFEHAAPLTEKI